MSQMPQNLAKRADLKFEFGIAGQNPQKMKRNSGASCFANDSSLGLIPNNDHYHSCTLQIWYKSINFDPQDLYPTVIVPIWLFTELSEHNISWSAATPGGPRKG